MVATRKEIDLDKRELAIINGVERYGNYVSYLDTISKSSIRNYLSKINLLLNSDLENGLISEDYYHEVKDFVKQKLNDDLSDEYKVLAQSLNNNLSALKEDTFIAASRLNILILSFFSILPLKKISNLEVKDIEIISKEEWIVVKIKKEKIEFGVMQFKPLFLALMNHIKNDTNRKYIVEADLKIDYSYFSKFCAFYFDETLCKGGIRSIKKIFTNKKIVSHI